MPKVSKFTHFMLEFREWQKGETCWHYTEITADLDIHIGDLNQRGAEILCVELLCMKKAGQSTLPFSLWHLACQFHGII